MKNIPKVIYLNLEEKGEDFKDHSQITWSEERINDNDIQFVLSDQQEKVKCYNCEEMVTMISLGEMCPNCC